PVLLQTSFLPASRCPGLEQADLDRQSLYALLAEQYAIRIGGISQIIEAATASAWRAAQLEVPRGAPLLVMDGVATDLDNRPVEAFRAVYRGDRARIALDAASGASATPSPLVSVLVT
ncbi:MAG: UTRA domain-containing protein, partial [Thermomicrobiales bacterium]